MPDFLRFYYRVFLLGLTLITICISPLTAQFSGQNIAEFQFGKIPDDSVAFASIYDRLVLDYDLKDFKFGVTLEQYWTPYEDRNYIVPNQFRIQYKTDKWDIRIGNFYETLGRGTMMRTYQVPGAILEDISYRSRTYFHRDFLGAYVKYQGKSWSVKTLAGQPLNNIFPPTFEYSQRRPDSIAVIGGDYQINTHKIEYNAMYLRNAGTENLYSMLNLSGRINPTITYYTELTIDNKGGVFGAEDEYGWYFNMNFQFDRLNITAELKDYNNIIIGEAVNEPPALIKQHVYRLLNRSTHVPIPINETGYQLEATYNFKNQSMLVFNTALAQNDLGTNFNYYEFFLEYVKVYNERFDSKVFIDFANDDIKGEMDRISAGIDLDILMNKRRSVNVEYEFQTFQRPDARGTNMLLSLAFNKGSKFTGSILTEYSTDNTVIEEGSSYKLWLGTNIKYKPGFKDTFLLFAGTRRGGPACTAGVCYEILDFEGVELRYTRRL